MRAIKLYESVDYEKSQECEFEIKENFAHNVYGKTINNEYDPSHSSLWHKPGGKFDINGEYIGGKRLERWKKLERINNYMKE